MRIKFRDLRTAAGALACAMLVSGGLLLAGASGVSAPEPARLNGALDGMGSVAPATYIHTERQTVGVQWPGSWRPGGIPELTPCTTTPVPAGTILYHIIRARGGLRKCV